MARTVRLGGRAAACPPDDCTFWGGGRPPVRLSCCHGSVAPARADRRRTATGGEVMSTRSNGPRGSLAPLSVGTPAPDFALPEAPHRTVMLHGLDGRAVVLAFYPMDWEPVSREQLALFQTFAADFG